MTEGLPTGTVTFLMSDVVASSELWQQFPSEMPDALHKHELIVRGVLESTGGYEFGTAGDSFAVAYSSPGRAIEAATEIQQKLLAQDWGPARIEIRIGLHSGQADERNGRYFGAVVNRASRIESVTVPGQILVSEATQALARGEVSDAISFRDQGEQNLRSFDRPERLFQVVAAGLPAGRALPETALADNLPNPPTSFIGRDRDVDSVSELILPGELVTITGLGGLGKTRLSIEAARWAAPRFADGIWWVDLTPLTDGGSIAGHAAGALGLTLQAGMSSDASLTDALRRKTALVVFDNCEHVITQAASLIASLRAACPDVAILATSREPLDLAGERNWPLSVMPASTDGVSLLIDRAKAHDATFDPDRWPESDLIDLCTRLDGMPLAIEMAAARLRALSPSEIIERLDDRFRLLRTRDRHAAERHQTLLAALDWSYELLDPDERLLLDRLSIFAGSFDVRGVEQVCADDRLDEFDILDLVTSLLEKSLISQVDGVGITRYRLLETVRQYCSGHLDDDETLVLRRALVAFSVQEAVSNEAKWLGDTRPDYDLAFAAFGNEWDNFRAAIRWAVDDNDAVACDSIFRALWIFAFETFRTEISDWARSALTLDPPSLVAAGVAAVTGSDRAESTKLLLDSTEQLDESTPSHEACLLYGVLHGMHIAQGGDVALHYAERSAFHATAMSTSRVASHRANLAMMLVDANPDDAAEHAQFAREYLDASSNPWRASCVSPLAMYEAKCGRPEIGHQLCVRGVDMSTDAGLSWTLNSVLACRARISLRYNVGEPREDLAHAIEVGRESRAWYAVWLAMAESVPWLQQHYPADLTSTVSGYMSQRKIWFRPATVPTHGEPATDDRPTQNPGSGMRRDELIDYLLSELAS